jgi:hypothetical protein
MDLSNGVVDVSSITMDVSAEEVKQDSFLASIMSKIDMATCIGGGLNHRHMLAAAGFAGALGPKKQTAPNKNSIF